MDAFWVSDCGSAAAVVGRGELLERLQTHLDLRDLELQLLSRAAELPAPQLRELDLQPLDLQAVLAHQALQVRYIIGKIVCLEHTPIIRAVLRHARRCWKITRATRRQKTARAQHLPHLVGLSTNTKCVLHQATTVGDGASSVDTLRCTRRQSIPSRSADNCAPVSSTAPSAACVQVNFPRFNRL